MKAAKKIEKGLYEYRGAEIERDTNTTAGTWGAWVIRLGMTTDYASSLKEAKNIVDEKLS